MRIKSTWFKEGREKTPQELAGAVSFIAWRIAENALKNMRSADFGVAVGVQYFTFLSEFLIFLVQVADRIAYSRFTAEFRLAFTTELAHRVAETLADNQSRLLGGAMAGHKSNLIERLNQRAGEYAEFEYGNDGPSFSFLRYFAHCMLDVVDERDKIWVTDQMMASVAPEAVEMVEKAMRSLLETEPRRRAARSAASGD
ncbi:MAG: hypothetical protein HY306_02755 [Nitrosomonadales bacterium]|nr:hypothetical protein [Nitrosomonadales bacterium]